MNAKESTCEEIVIISIILPIFLMVILDSILNRTVSVINVLPSGSTVIGVPLPVSILKFGVYGSIGYLTYRFLGGKKCKGG